MNKKLTVGIIVLIIVPISIFIYFSMTTNQPIVVELSLISENLDNTSISEVSLRELERVINENMLVKDQQKLIDIYNREKSNYINLITILSILLTVFSLFTVISSFVDKSQTEKLSKDMNEKIEQYDRELKKIYFKNLNDNITNKIVAFRDRETLLLDEQTPVKDFITFFKYFDMTTNAIFEYVKEKGIEEKIKVKHFYINYLNYVIYATSYAYEKKYILVDKLDVNENEVFRNAISKIFNFFDKDTYLEFKETVSKIKMIDWSNY